MGITATMLRDGEATDREVEIIVRRTLAADGVTWQDGIGWEIGDLVKGADAGVTISPNMARSLSDLDFGDGVVIPVQVGRTVTRPTGPLQKLVTSAVKPGKATARTVGTLELTDGRKATVTIRPQVVEFDNCWKLYLHPEFNVHGASKNTGLDW